MKKSIGHQREYRLIWRESGQLKTLINMNNKKIMKLSVKRVVKLSWIYESARKEFDVMKKHPDLDPDFFTEDELDHYVGVIVRNHIGDWLVIDDRDERAI